MKKKKKKKKKNLCLSHYVSLSLSYQERNPIYKQ